MTQQSLQHGSLTLPARRSRPARFARLRCESFEDRITPAVFTVQPPQSPIGLNNNGCVAVADFNRDGFQDAVLTNFGDNIFSPGNSIVILYGNGSGGFNRVQRNTGGTNVSFATVADINSDTFPDLVVTNGNQQNIGSVAVFRNDGAGNLSLVGGAFSSGGNNAACVQLADLTGDGVLDLVVANFGFNQGEGVPPLGNRVTIFQGLADAQGHGNFTYSPAPIVNLEPAVQFIPSALAVADFDGDGFADIAAAVTERRTAAGEPLPNGSVYLFKGTGSGAFAAPDILDSAGGAPVNIQAADLNGDTKLDLVLANAGDPGEDPNNPHYLFTNSSVGILLNVSTPGSLNFGIPTSLVANTRGTFAVAVADFNLDGRQDIASVNYGAPINNPQDAFVSVYLRNALGQYVPDTPGMYDTQTGFAGGQYLAVGDFNNNGTPDLIVAHASNEVGLLFNTSSPAVRPTVTGVTVNEGQTNTTQRSKVTSIKIAFNTQVTFAGSVANAFQLSRIGGGAVGGFTATATVVNGHTEVTLTGFTGAETQFGSLADGRYQVLVRANQVTAGGLQLDGNGDGTSGDDYTLNGTVANGLYRLYGDGNADGVINAADFGPFRGAFGASTGQTAYIDWLDVNGDGVINAFDFGQFRTRFGSSVP